MKWFLLNVGEILIDKINIPIAQSCSWTITGWGYIQANSGEYKGKYLHKIIAELAGLDTSDEIDHEDMDLRNNLISNLRPATRAQNNMNNRIQSNNISGYIGVSWDEEKQKYKAQINRKHLGYFDTAEEASAVRWAAAKKLHKEFARFE